MSRRTSACVAAVPPNRAQATAYDREPLMSAKIAVTVLRSPSTVEGDSGVVVAGTSVAEAAAARAAPHSPQNFLAAGFSEAHLEQRLTSADPQSEQNRLPSGFSEPHFVQHIESPENPSD